MTILHVNTPLLQSLTMSDQLNGQIWLKMEALQPCGSFKARGVGHACRHYVETGYHRLLSSSGGNAGLAVAYAGRRLQVPVTVIVPQTTGQRAIDLIKLEGADVIVHGENWSAAHQEALRLADEETALIHPFDDPWVWDGHASLVDEIKAAGQRPDAVVLAVGGGGLLCGIVQGLQRNGWSDVPILAVETQGAASLHICAVSGRHETLPRIDSIANTLGASQVARQAFDYLQTYPIVSHIVSDEEALDACRRFLVDQRLLVEPACGAALAAVYGGADFLRDKANILVIVCGGAGVTPDLLDLVRRGAPENA